MTKQRGVRRRRYDTMMLDVFGNEIDMFSLQSTFSPPAQGGPGQLPNSNSQADKLTRLDGVARGGPWRKFA